MIYKSLFSKQKTALADISLEIEENQIYGILGPNGAGKTTLISIMSTLLLPTRGEVRVLGMDVVREAKRIRWRINISSGNPNLPWSLTVCENLRYYAMSYGFRDEKKIDELIEFFELEDYRDVEFDVLSTGNKQKVCLAKAFVNDPELVFLDEPTVGLDPDVARRLRKKILDFQEENGTTIVLTTHYMGEAEMLCDRIAFLNKGRIVAEGTPKDLKKMIKKRDRIIIHVDGKVSSVGLEGVYGVEEKNGKLIFYVDDAEKRLGSLVKEIAKQSKIKNVSVKEVDLEDVFVELAKRA